MAHQVRLTSKGRGRRFVVINVLRGLLVLVGEPERHGTTSAAAPRHGHSLVNATTVVPPTTMAVARRSANL
jgi:hypothetical protein